MALPKMWTVPQGPQPAQQQTNSPWQMLQQRGPQPAVISPRTNVGATYQDFPRATSPWQQALAGSMGPGNTIAKEGPGAGFLHPFANAGVGGTPWSNPALRQQIQAYEKLVAKDRAGGLTASERKQLDAARKKLQESARDQSQSAMPGWEQTLRQVGQQFKSGKAAAGDAFQSVLRDMMGRMFQQQGQAGGAGG